MALKTDQVTIQPGGNSSPFLDLQGYIENDRASNISTVQGSGSPAGPGSSNWTFSEMLQITVVDQNGTSTTRWVPSFVIASA